MSNSWKQYVLGKLVTSSSGPIVRGRDHECTGKSLGIPENIQLAMRPSVVGPGTSDLTNWFEYTWNEEGGGIAIQPILNNEDFWVVAGRVRGRSEAGEGEGGRYYTQTHYVAQKASDYETHSVAQLFEGLDAQPMVQKEQQMSEVSWTQNPIALPEKWFERILPFLRYTLSGIPFAVKSRKQSLQEISLLFHLVHISLPKTLAWRMGLRIGAENIHENDVTLSWGQDVHGGPRMIGFSWDDFERNNERTRQTEEAKKHPVDSENQILGDRYIEYMKEHFVGRCSTDMELQKAVAGHFSHFDVWDGIDPDLNFGDAAEVFILDIFEKDNLQKMKEALPKQLEFPSLQFFKSYRKEAFVLVFPTIWNQGSDFMFQSIQKWPDIWNQCANEMPDVQTVHALFFDTDTLDEKVAEVLCKEIPLVFHERIQKRLQKSLEDWAQYKEEEHSFWNRLSSFEQVPKWLEAWLQEKGDFLFWCNFRRRDKKMNGIHTSLQSRLTAFLYWNAIKNNQALPEFDTKKWFQSAFTDRLGTEEQSKVIEEILIQKPLLALQMLEQIPEPIPLSKKMQFPEFLNWLQLGTIVEKTILMLETKKDIPKILMEMLIASYFTQTEEDQDIISTFLSTKISPEWGWLYFGMENFCGDGHLDDIVEGIYCQKSNEIKLENVIALENLSLQKAVQRKFLSLVDAKKIQSICPYVQLRISKSKTTTKDMDLNLLNFALEGCTLQAIDINDTHLLKAYLQSRHDPFVLSSQLLIQLYQLSDEELVFWSDWISQSTSQNHSGWRLIWLRNNRPISFIQVLDPLETKCLAKWNDADKWKLFLSGVRLSEEWLPRMNPEKTFGYINTEEVALAIWLSSFSDSSTFQIKVLCDGLMFLQDHAPNVYKELKRQYGSTSQGWFSSVTSKLGHLGSTIGRAFTKEIPLELPLMETVSDALRGIPEEKRIRLFL